MWNTSREGELMQLMDSEDERPNDLFVRILDNRSQYDIFGQCFQPKNDKLNFEKFMEQGQAISGLQKLETKQKYNENDKPECMREEQQKSPDIPAVKQVTFQEPVDKEIKFSRTRPKTIDKNKKTTRCTSKPENQEVLELNDEKQTPSILADFTCENDLNSSVNKGVIKKLQKFKKKIDKHIFKKENHFKKSFKISFPKKIVEMFINHYQDYFEEDSQVLKYNNDLRQRLKQNKKNDYTFDKEVCQILGQSRDIEPELSREISFVNRRIFSQIVRQTMKEEVIMRDKISQNRQLYMIQLKVYALRCRSHRLSKKGTFK